MSWQTVALEPFDGATPAIIHDAAAIEAAEVTRQAMAAAKAAAEAQEVAEQRRHIGLMQALEELGVEAPAHRVEAIAAISGAVAEATSKLLPTLADDAFVSEMTAAVVDLVSRSDLATPVLCVAPDNHDRVVAALSAREPRFELAVSSDPELRSDQARLRWDGGGADFDAETLTQLARDALRARLNTLQEHRT